VSSATAATLVALALVDSTSFGTLLIPVWLLLVPGRTRWGRVLLFLGTVAVSYLVLGVALSAGAGPLLEGAGRLRESTAATWAQLVLGVGLLVWGFLLGRGSHTGARRPGRLLAWRERAVGSGADGGGLGGVVGLALGATALEAATMLPYLGAIGLLGASDLTLAQRTGVLAGYCLVMVAPALLLLAGRVLASARVEPALAWIAARMERAGGGATAWVVGIVGFLVARDAVVRIPGFLDALQRW
jgi:hypothetical protein